MDDGSAIVNVGGYTIFADGSDPSPELPTLEEGVRYRLTISGSTFMEEFWDEQTQSLASIYGDAEYAERMDSSSGSEGPDDTYEGVDVGVRLGGVDGDTWWGPHRADGTYAIDVIGTGDDLTAKFLDFGSNADDTGYFTLNIEKRLAPIVNITPLEDAGAEDGPASLRFLISANGNMQSDLVVGYDLSGTADPDDYESLSGFVTIGADMESTELEILPIDDSVVVDDENVFVSLRPAPATDARETYQVGEASVAEGYIADNDAGPGITVESTTVKVGESDELTITVKDDDGDPRASVSLSVVSVDTAVVGWAWKDGNNVTDGNGHATIVVTGITSGATVLCVADGGAAQGQGEQKVGANTWDVGQAMRIASYRPFRQGVAEPIVQVTAGEDVIFNMEGTDGDILNAMAQLGQGPYQLRMTIDGNATFKGGGITKVLDRINPADEARIRFDNVVVQTAQNWNGQQITVEAQLIDNWVKPAADQGNAKDNSVKQKWFLIARTTPAPTDMTPAKPAPEGDGKEGVSKDLRNIGPLRFTYDMLPDRNGAGNQLPNYAGQCVVEEFSAPYGYLFTKDDFDPAWLTASGLQEKSLKEIVDAIVNAGRNGTFVIDDQDRIMEVHTGITFPLEAFRATYRRNQTFSIKIDQTYSARQTAGGNDGFRKTYVLAFVIGTNDNGTESQITLRKRAK